MLYGASNGHMTNDVTTPQKVKVVTQIYLESNNFLTLGDRGSTRHKRCRYTCQLHIKDDDDPATPSLELSTRKELF